LDRVSDAIEHLKHAIQSSSDVFKSVTPDLFSNNSPTAAYPKTCSQAKAIVYSNLAASYSLQNNFEKASKQILILTESIPPDMVSYRTILTVVYILLKEGDNEKALHILRTKNISHFKHSNKG
jgi:tetratricopeptide (TPR) repeat protein